MTTTSFTVSIQKQTYIVGSDTYWLRIEDPSEEEELVTQDDIDTIVENLYDIDSCNGTDEQKTTEEVKNDSSPTREDLYEAAYEQLGDLSACQSTLAGDYEKTIKVYRSHIDEGYSLILEYGKVLKTEIKEETKDYYINIENSSSYTLNFAVLSDLKAAWVNSRVIAESGSIAAPTIKRDGNTIYWDTSCTGTIRVKFATSYDLVTVSVPGEQKYDGSLIGDKRTINILALYHSMVFQGTVKPPADDTSISTGLLEQICNYISTSQLGSVTSPNSTDDSPFEEESSKYGCLMISSLALDPDFYKDKCCVDNENPNGCILRAERNPGGKTISNEDIERYTKKENLLGSIGPNAKTEFIAVSPNNPGGCGTIYYDLRLNSKNCCDEVPSEVLIDRSTIPEILPHGESVTIYASGGKLPYTWEVSNEQLNVNGKSLTITEVPWVILKATDEFCGAGAIVLTDGCSTDSTMIRSDQGSWEKIGGKTRNITTLEWENEWGSSCMLSESISYYAGTPLEFAGDHKTTFDITSERYRQIETIKGVQINNEDEVCSFSAPLTCDKLLSISAPKESDFCMSIDVSWDHNKSCQDIYGIRTTASQCWGNWDVHKTKVYQMVSSSQEAYIWRC